MEGRQQPAKTDVKRNKKGNLRAKGFLMKQRALLLGNKDSEHVHL
jgi:hypothetical protein